MYSPFERSFSARRMAAQRELNELKAELKALKAKKEAELNKTPRDLDRVAGLDKDLDRVQNAINAALFSGEYHVLVLSPRLVHSTPLSGPPAGCESRRHQSSSALPCITWLSPYTVLTAVPTEFSWFCLASHLVLVAQPALHSHLHEHSWASESPFPWCLCVLVQVFVVISLVWLLYKPPSFEQLDTKRAAAHLCSLVSCVA